MGPQARGAPCRLVATCVPSEVHFIVEYFYGNKSPSRAVVPEILLSSLELALVFPLRKGRCSTGAVSISLSLRTKVSIQ